MRLGGEPGNEARSGGRIPIKDTLIPRKLQPFRIPVCTWLGRLSSIIMKSLIVKYCEWYS